ncbi:MAG: hypothetical protein SW833_06660 [Cyanobacteriota bacterium]|nr:hypothetical protein [Cyanobacteriota bacterium]
MSIEKFKSLLQKQWSQEWSEGISHASIWFPSVVVTLFALSLWAYLMHPEWIEGNIDEENASTGELLSTDPNSPVTEADLSLDDLATVAETESVSSILEQVSLSNAAETDEESEENPEASATVDGSTPGQQNAIADAPENKPPNIEANNPFASAIQTFLTGNKSGGSSSNNTKEETNFSPLLSVFQNGQDAPNLSQQSLSESNPSEENATAPLVPGSSTSTETNSGTPLRTAQTPSPVGNPSSSSRAGQTPYIPGQIPYTFPGRTPSQPANSGFINPVPGSSTYYPTQRGTGGYQVTPGGTTYSRQRGNTGSVVTRDGIIGPRQRGSTGTVVTPQGTTYTRQRGTTGFTAPPTSPNAPVAPNVQPSPFGTSPNNP